MQLIIIEYDYLDVGYLKFLDKFKLIILNYLDNCLNFKMWLNYIEEVIQFKVIFIKYFDLI